ncbi:MAG: hypothetical protein GX848_05795 [Clostridiales bacterium]|jgi:hypothetical protein|nr:hypothetical protein [Clostridiales bacterium]
MAEKETKEFLTYKGKPLVRNGNTLYYGHMSDDFVIMMTIGSTKKEGELDIADKVTISLINTDPNVRPKDKIVKKSEKNGLWAAMDIGSIWLERALAQK